MDMIDILGGMLGEKSSRSGGDILKDIFGKAMRPSSRSRTSSIPTEDEIEQSAKELEDMLNVAKERSTAGRSQPAPRHDSGTAHRTPPASGSTTESGDRALILVRAMVNAAKADGQIDQIEQQNILERLSDRSPQTIEFLRQEFARPLDVHDFARSVPLGMEQQVYMLSLATMKLDTAGEAQYLTELAEGLRISPEVRNQIHERLGAPSIY